MYFFSVLACTVSSLFNELDNSLSVSFWVSRPACAFRENSKNQLRYLLFRNPFLNRGCKGTHYFLISKSFFKNFSIFIFLRQPVKELHFLYSRPFFERGCKGRHYFLISKSFFSRFFNFFSSCLSLLKNSRPLQPPFSQMGLQRYDFFLYFQIFLQQSLSRNQPEHRNKTPNTLPLNALSLVLHFC